MYPEDLLYTKSHEWVKVEDDRAIVGVTSYAQDQLVEVVFVELPEEGKEVKAGDAVATLESVKAVADVYAPVSGKIIEVNKQLENQPELVNQDPYGEGWIFVIEIAGEEELHTLMKVSDYQSLIENELKP
ncbi:MAG TPA: glycine cleavage system protein GcvH [Candidatus Atribacteria bacterium]|uniref:glycine cleavage system protein GcvH n=1 Tax=Candidatus Sordicultor fermentans TaxID=1953203 RepID=UPI0016B98416|nr:glycine cleavage system protein GcvH [Atribacterota bacterium]NLY04935.1 glycine cleavage system protein GcvH [Candidatus Atribacteria bacterium]MDI9606740.1 glycine cleavage system protein GcvH [Atribacterota bacterium]HOQ50430.1 glycine cleavage system protein GcvH [Candidatus Atribacteria bacterium]HPT62919.1 glycine cleavage system protein GcvH [Candidatus Atribacteria bacterium]